MSIPVVKAAHMTQTLMCVNLNDPICIATFETNFYYSSYDFLDISLAALTGSAERRRPSTETVMLPAEWTKSGGGHEEQSRATHHFLSII